MPGEGTAPFRHSTLDSRFMAALGLIVTLALVAVPLAVTPDLLDRYRVLKESIVRAEGILGGVLLVAAVAFAGTRRVRELLQERGVILVTVAAVAWGIVTSIISTHHGHSVESLVTLITTVLVFLTAWYAAPRMSLVVFDVLVPVTLLNVVLLALQEYGIYQPFYFDSSMSGHLTTTGLIDNPNIVGTYMTLVATVFAAAALRAPRWRKALYGFGAVVAIAGVVLSQTRTAVIALFAGLLLLALGRSLKRAVIVVSVVAVLGGLSVYMRNDTVMRVLALPGLLRSQSVEVVTSGRAAPVATAWQMFRDRPFTGLGPGTFKYHYMPYKAALLRDHPAALRGTTPTNFGEVHNDHAQLLAETGLPGYLLFLSAAMLIVRAVRRHHGGDSRQQIASSVILPLVGALLVLCLAQFPLYVAITRHLLATMAGLLMGWSGSSANE